MRSMSSGSQIEVGVAQLRFKLRSSDHGTWFGEHIQAVQEHDSSLAAVTVNRFDVLEAVVQGGARETVAGPVQGDASGAEHRAFGDDAGAGHAGVVFFADQVEQAWSHGLQPSS
jgi:hypothetical protein